MNPVVAALDAQIATALELGCTTLGYDRAYVIVHGTGLDEHTGIVFPRPEIEPARAVLRHDAHRLFVRRGDAIVEVRDLDDSPLASAIWLPDPRARSYAGIRVPLRADRFATVNLTGLAPRERALDARERSILTILGNMIGHIYEDVERREALSAMAYFDPLTGLPNRLALAERFARLLESAKNEGRRFAVLFIDLDRFKSVNDRYGHARGDALLAEVARRLRGALRSQDTIARIGGDEFVVLQSGVNGEEEAARQLARKLISVVHDIEQLGDARIDVSASVGIALYPQDGTVMDVLLERADQALYHAKRRSPGGVVRFAETAHIDPVLRELRQT